MVHRFADITHHNCHFQSQVYRGIIDDVINNVRQDFEEMGIEKEVLEELQRVSTLPFDSR